MASPGFEFTSLDTELFDGCGVTKGELIDYLTAMAEPMITELAQRPLSVIRARPGSKPFMQKNLPSHAPSWIPTADIWAETSHRTVRHPLVSDPRALLWLGNQRSVEFHPSLVRVDQGLAEELILDLDPAPTDDLGAGFEQAVTVALLVRQVLDDCGLVGEVKTSGAKGLHIRIPVEPTSFDRAAHATRALAARTAALDPAVATTEFIRADRGGRLFVDPTRVGAATLVAAWSPRARPGLPISQPVTWEELPETRPDAYTVRNVGVGGPWRQAPARAISDELVAEGELLPVPRVAAMHEGLRRARARRNRAGQ